MNTPAKKVIPVAGTFVTTAVSGIIFMLIKIAMVGGAAQLAAAMLPVVFATARSSTESSWARSTCPFARRSSSPTNTLSRVRMSVLNPDLLTSQTAGPARVRGGIVSEADVVR